MPERFKFTMEGYNEMASNRHRAMYYISKAIKELIMKSGKHTFTYHDVDKYFTDRVFLNFINEMILELFEKFEWTMVNKLNYSDAHYDDKVPDVYRNNTVLARAKRNVHYIAKDPHYLMFTEQVRTNTSFLFKESLSNNSDFRTGLNYYQPIFENRTLDSFRSPLEPYLILESDLDTF